MEKVYRIGSFNLHNIGIGAFANDRDLENMDKLYELIQNLAANESKVEGISF